MSCLGGFFCSGKIMQNESLSLLGLFGSAFVSSTIAPGGSEGVLAYMATTETHPINLLVAIATIGNTLGALTTWWLGSWTAKKYPLEKVLAANKRQSIDTVRKWGGWALLFSWLPVVGDGLCFAAGWLKLAVPQGVLAIILGKASRYAVIAYAASEWI